MSVTLPTTPAPRKMDPHFLDFGGNQKPAMGGKVQRINRLGDRFGFDVELPPTEAEPDGRIWAARLVRGKRQGVLMRVAQPGVDTGAPGAPVVDGAGQAGSVLSLRGLTPGYTLREGQFLSLIIGGRRYLYQCAGDATASGGGLLTTSLTTLLREPPTNGATAEIAQPMVEGLIMTDVSWSPDLAAHYGFAFTLDESE